MLKALLRPWRVALAAAFIVAIGGIAAVATQQSAPGIDEVITLMLKREHIPGAVVAFGRSGQAPQLRAYGYADVETARPMRTADRFRLASLSKPVAAAAVLKLARLGKLQLDQQLIAFFPEISNAVDSRYRDITVLDLLRHSGGWNRDRSFDPIADPDGARRKLGVDTPSSCRPIATAMLAHHLDFSPGTAYAYSNLGYCWLEQIIELVSGSEYDEAVRQLVFHDDIFVDLASSLTTSWANATVSHYVNVGAGPPPQHSEGPADWSRVLGAAGGWVADAETVYRFASRPLDGVTLGRPPYALSDDPQFYGLGWRVWPDREGNTLTHYGSLPGVFSLVIRTSAQEIIVALFNARPSDDVGAFHRLLALLPEAVAHD